MSGFFVLLYLAVNYLLTVIIFTLLSCHNVILIPTSELLKSCGSVQSCIAAHDYHYMIAMVCNVLRHCTFCLFSIYIYIVLTYMDSLLRLLRAILTCWGPWTRQADVAFMGTWSHTVHLVVLILWDEKNNAWAVWGPWGLGARARRAHWIRRPCTYWRMNIYFY